MGSIQCGMDKVFEKHSIFQSRLKTGLRNSVTTLTNTIAPHVFILDTSHCDQWTSFYCRNEMSCDFSQWIANQLDLST